MGEVAGPAGDGRPDPDVAVTAHEFVDALRRLKNWAGVGFRRLETRAARCGQPLPRSTMIAALSRDTLPREDLVATLTRICGCDDDEVRRWVAARRRIAGGASDPSPGWPPHLMARPRVWLSAQEPVRCTLPCDQAVFVGRDKDLQEIFAAAEAARHRRVMAVGAIDGMPGVGKTALAVHAAHRLKDSYGDRQLFVDLHAHSRGVSPMPPTEVLAQLLTADGVGPQSISSTVDGRAALWRDRMVGKRALLVLDNAASTEQVVPLLPGSPDCLVLITSRRKLGDLSAASPVPLEVLTSGEAASMFLRLICRACTDREPVAELVRACGCLPLAISIVAGLCRRHPSWTMAQFCAEVHGSTGDLLTVTSENRTVAAVFDLSYEHLCPDRQRFFRLLGLHPGADIDTCAAAALAGTSVKQAQRHLDGLYADGLVDELGYRRYRMHDLIRAYAHALAGNLNPAGNGPTAITGPVEPAGADF